ncbi:MAG TPA: hypothetical protein PKV72_04420 [Candidatus Peribacteria bacterium]|nr:hypothetical protein [Candidatus Peribacteria bacterium]
MRLTLLRAGLPVLLLCWLLPAAMAMDDIPQSDALWAAQPGDMVVVDTSVSIVYLVHPDGQYMAMNGLTGQRRVVAYDGLVYNAATPTREWELRGVEKKGRSVTFGNGRFGRLYWPGHDDPRRGDEGTAYGIHSHLSFAKMLQDKAERTAWDRDGTGHRSMGCVLVSEEDLTRIEESLAANGGVMRVSTRDSVDPVALGTPQVAAADETVMPSWLGGALQ